MVISISSRLVGELYFMAIAYPAPFYIHRCASARYIIKLRRRRRVESKIFSFALYSNIVRSHVSRGISM